MKDLDIFWPEELKAAREESRLKPQAAKLINSLLKRDLLAIFFFWLFMAMFGHYWITVLIFAFIIPVLRFDMARFAKNHHLLQEGEA